MLIIMYLQQLDLFLTHLFDNFALGRQTIVACQQLNKQDYEQKILSMCVSVCMPRSS